SAASVRRRLTTKAGSAQSNRSIVMPTCRRGNAPGSLNVLHEEREQDRPDEPNHEARGRVELDLRPDGGGWDLRGPDESSGADHRGPPSQRVRLASEEPELLWKLCVHLF